MRKKILGLGERSFHKSYYPELQKRNKDLERFRRLLDKSNDFIFLIELPSGTVIDMNEPAMDFFGLHPDHIENINFKDITSRQLWQEIHNLTGSTNDTSVSHTCMCQFNGKNNANLYMELTVGVYTFAGKNCAIIVARNVSERQRALRALQKSKDTLKSIFNTAPVGMALIENEIIIRLNHNMANIIGGKRKDLLHNHICDLFYDSDEYQKTQKKICQDLKENHFGSTETIWKKSTGEYIHVLINYSYIDTNDLNKHIVLTVLDITERKKSRLQIIENESKFRATFEHAGVGIAHITTDGRFLKLNSRFSEILGYTTDEMLATNFRVILHPDDQMEYFDTINSLLKGSIPTYSCEKRYLHKSGAYIWIQLTLSVAYDQINESDYLIAIIEDITETKRLKNKIERNEQFLNSIIESIDDGLCVIDTDYHILRANRSFQLLHNMPESYEGKSCFAFLRGKSSPCNGCPAQQTISTGKVRKVIMPWPDDTNPKRWFEIILYPFKPHGDAVEGIIEYTKDITAKVIAEQDREKLIANLEEKNAELERFAYTVSHDLKAPLVTIGGFIELIEKKSPGMSSEDLSLYLKRIKKATIQMRHLLNDLLDLARIGHLTNQPDRIDVIDIIHDSLEVLAITIEQYKVEITYDKTFPEIFADHQQLLEVFVNLIDNAIKYSKDRNPPKIHIGVIYEDNQPVLYVRDNGIGIEQAYFDKIFGLFNKLSANTEGTGVGLALVKRIVEFHKGSVWVDSGGADKGTTFYFTLPYFESEAQHPCIPTQEHT